MARMRQGGRLRSTQRGAGWFSFPDEESLLAAWRDYQAAPSDELRNKLMEHYGQVVRYVGDRIAAKLPDEVDVDDLISAGNFGLMRAIDAFDLDRGVKFETYCTPRIRGAILDELRSMDWVPRLVRYRAQRLTKTIRALESEFGRPPTEDEIAGRMNLPAAEFNKLVRDAHAISQVSISRSFTDSDSNREVAEIDVLPDEQSIDPVVEAQKRDIRDAITRELGRAERLIVVLYYDEGMTMKEIGATLDLSESRVSQMHSAIMNRLRDCIETREESRRESVDVMT